MTDTVPIISPMTDIEHKKIYDQLYGDDYPAWINDLICNRFYNRAHFVGTKPPVSQRAIVIGGGPSWSTNKEAVGASLGKYDMIILTPPACRVHLKDDPRMWVIDADCIVDPKHWGYFDPGFKVRLIASYERTLMAGWKSWIEQIYFLAPPEPIDWKQTSRLTFGHYPASSGAQGIRVALFDCGGGTTVDIVGVDCTGNNAKWREETANLINANHSRVNLLFGCDPLAGVTPAPLTRSTATTRRAMLRSRRARKRDDGSQARIVKCHRENYNTPRCRMRKCPYLDVCNELSVMR